MSSERVEYRAPHTGHLYNADTLTAMLHLLGQIPCQPGGGGGILRGMGMRPVTFKLDPYQTALLDDACRAAGFDNRSSCLRSLVFTFVSVVNKAMEEEKPTTTLIASVVKELFNNWKQSGRVPDTRILAAAAVAAVAERIAAEVAHRVDDYVTTFMELRERGEEAIADDVLEPVLEPNFPMMAYTGRRGDGEGGSAIEAA